MKDLDHQLRSYYDEVVQRVDPLAQGGLEHEPAQRSRRGWVVAGVAAAAVLVVGAVTVLLVGNGPAEVDSADSATTLPSEATVGPAETTVSVGDTPILWTAVRMETFGDFTLAWNGHEIWRYASSTWSPYAAAPTGPWDLAYTSGTVWALAGHTLVYLEAGGWHRLDAAPPQVWRIAAEPDSGILWISTGKDLHRWDGTEMTDFGHPPNWEGDGEAGDGQVGDIAVTSDGTVWATGLNGYVPWLGGLSRFDEATGTWEMVRPLGGNENVPAALLAPTPDGDLWVLLADWFEDWEGRAREGEPSTEFTLARHDSATGEWLVYDSELPEGFPTQMVSDGDSVWLARSGGAAGFDAIGGIARFDGRTWTTYLEDLPVDDTVDDIAVASDGTIWYTVNGEIHQLGS